MEIDESSIYDAIIIGGGPAGMSAAMHLAFQERKVLILDRRSSPMNFYTNPVNNYPGPAPLQKGREIFEKIKQDAIAQGAKIHFADVKSVSGEYPRFVINAQDKSGEKKNMKLLSKTLIIATGVARKHPLVQGKWRKWLPYAGKNEISYYCTDCEAPLTKKKDVLVINSGTVNSALHVARLISPFTRRVRIFMTEDSYSPYKTEYSKILEKSKFEWFAGKIEKIEIKNPSQHQTLYTVTGEKITCEQFFVAFIAEPRNDIPLQLGITVDDRGCVMTDHRGKTNIEGIWAAGDIRPITQSVAMAVGTGNYAGIMINKFLDRDHYSGTETDHPEERMSPITKVP